MSKTSLGYLKGWEISTYNYSFDLPMKYFFTFYSNCNIDTPKTSIIEYLIDSNGRTIHRLDYTELSQGQMDSLNLKEIIEVVRKFNIYGVRGNFCDEKIGFYDSNECYLFYAPTEQSKVIFEGYDQMTRLKEKWYFGKLR